MGEYPAEQRIFHSPTVFTIPKFSITIVRFYSKNHKFLISQPGTWRRTKGGETYAKSNLSTERIATAVVQAVS
jgi:hypothetical protein